MKGTTRHLSCGTARWTSAVHMRAASSTLALLCLSKCLVLRRRVLDSRSKLPSYQPLHTCVPLRASLVVWIVTGFSLSLALPHPATKLVLPTLGSSTEDAQPALVPMQSCYGTPACRVECNPAERTVTVLMLFAATEFGLEAMILCVVVGLLPSLYDPPWHCCFCTDLRGDDVHAAARLNCTATSSYALVRLANYGHLVLVALTEDLWLF